MEFRSDGYENFEIPAECLNFNNYLNKSELKGDLENFVSSSHQNILYGDVEENVRLKPILNDSDDEDED